MKLIRLSAAVKDRLAQAKQRWLSAASVAWRTFAQSRFGWWLIRTSSNLWHRLVYTYFYTDVESIHRLSAGSALWWSILLLSPYHLFRTQPSFASLGRIAPERDWGYAMIGAAAFHMCGMLVPKAWMQCLVFMTSLFTWGFIAILLAHDGFHINFYGIANFPFNTGVGIYMTVGLENFLGLIRAGRYFILDIHAYLLRRYGLSS